nr:restriction endonuclease subunit S [uncultured Rhodoferax sp.]
MSGETALFGSLFSAPQKNGLTRPKAVRGAGMPMVNMGELFAYPRIHNLVMDLVPVSDSEAHFLLEPEDLLFARQSLVLEGAGQCSIFVENKKPTVFESHLIRCRLNKSISNPYFYFYFFRSPAGRTAIETIAEQGAGASGIRGSDLVKLSVPCPPKVQQDAVAAILTALDDRITLLRETNATLEAIAQALFKSWFVDFDPVRAKLEGRAPEGMDEATARLFPDSFEELELGLMPTGWRVARIDELMELAYGKALKATDRIAGEVPVYGSGGITGFHNESLVTGPSIIIGRKGTVGSLYWEDQPFFAIDTVFYVRTANPMTYCFYLLQTLGLTEMNTDAAVPGLNRGNVYRLTVPFPGAEILGAFDDIVGVIRKRIFKNSQQAQTLATLRDTLLPRLISGQLRLPEAQAAAEDALA